MARILAWKIDTELYKELLRIEQQFKALERKRAELREALVGPTCKAGKITIEGCVFEVQERNNYEYSEEVGKLEAQVKARKAYEVAAQIARVKEPTRFIKITEVDKRGAN